MPHFLAACAEKQALAVVVEDVLDGGLATSGHRLQKLLINGVNLGLEVIAGAVAEGLVGVALDLVLAGEQYLIFTPFCSLNFEQSVCAMKTPMLPISALGTAMTSLA